MTIPNGLKHQSVLIVDDERIIADTLRLILLQNGFHAISAYDGKAAIEEARRMSPDVLLCDVMMPQLNGIEVAIEVRRILPECRILLLSGQAEVHDLLVEARSCGHDFQLLVKPVHPEDLLAQLRSRS